MIQQISSGIDDAAPTEESVMQLLCVFDFYRFFCQPTTRQQLRGFPDMVTSPGGG